MYATNLVVLALSIASSQTPRLAFEVASVKQNPPGDNPFMFQEQPGGRLTISGTSLKQLIALAYRMKLPQISGGPDWVDSTSWSIVAKADSDSPRRQTVSSYIYEPDPTALRIQSLLEERFALKTHRELRELAVYELVVAKNGPRLSQSKDQTPVMMEWQGSMLAFELASGQPVPPPPPMPGVSGPVQNPEVIPARFNGLPFIARTDKGLRFVGNAIPIANLVFALAPALDRPIVDKTGLKDLYDMRFDWTPDLRTSALLPTLDPSGPSLFTAIQDELGLKLVPIKTKIEVIVIDSAKKPSNDQAEDDE
jgi:uncharacterized protein (TIGR03435 family)